MGANRTSTDAAALRLAPGHLDGPVGLCVNLAAPRGTWDFPLSNKEKVHRLIKLYNDEVERGRDWEAALEKEIGHLGASRGLLRMELERSEKHAFRLQRLVAELEDQLGIYEEDIGRLEEDKVSLQAECRKLEGRIPVSGIECAIQCDLGRLEGGFEVCGGLLRASLDRKTREVDRLQEIVLELEHQLCCSEEDTRRLRLDYLSLQAKCRLSYGGSPSDPLERSTQRRTKAVEGHASKVAELQETPSELIEETPEPQVARQICLGCGNACRARKHCLCGGFFCSSQCHMESWPLHKEQCNRPGAARPPGDQPPQGTCKWEESARKTWAGRKGG